MGVKGADGLSTETTEVESVAPPRIVVGVPPSEPPPPVGSADALDRETPAPSASASVSSERPSVKTEAATEHGSEAPQSSNREASGPRSFASTLAFGSSMSVDPPPSASTPSAKAEGAPEPSSLAPSASSADRKKSKKERKKERDAAAATKEAAATKTAGADEARAAASTPPASGEGSPTSEPPTDDVDDEQFFSEGEASARRAGEILSDDALTVIDKARRKSEPAVVERRERFARYVKIAVGVAGVVCLLAVARTLFSSDKPAIQSTSPTAAMVATETPTVEPKAAVPAAAPLPTAVMSAEKAKEPTAEGAAAVVAAAPATSALASAAVVESAPETKPDEGSGDPKAEKAKARTSLEKRKIADAIEAGERSVALDPTDGEAWLILGAAYQEKGNIVAARRAYSSCVKEGKTGPRHECAQMLR